MEAPGPFLQHGGDEDLGAGGRGGAIERHRPGALLDAIEEIGTPGLRVELRQLIERQGVEDDGGHHSPPSEAATWRNRVLTAGGM